MQYIKFDIFTKKPRLLGNNNAASADAACVAVPDSFSLSKTIKENVKTQEKDSSGQVLYEAYKDSNGNYFRYSDTGLTKIEATHAELKDVSGYALAMTDELRDVTVTADTRIQEFTADEIYYGIGLAVLADNPAYTHVVSGNLGSAFSVWDFPGSDNLIMGDFEVTIYPATTVQTIVIPLAVSASEVLGVFDIDEGVGVEVSVDGGAVFTPLIHDVPENILVAGSSLVVKFVNNSTSDRKNIRGFSLLYK
jgi:hypothetical protein